jgi:hypothetical protein
METIFPGLILYRNFLSNSIEDELLNEIGSQKWVVDYDRRL